MIPIKHQLKSTPKIKSNKMQSLLISNKIMKIKKAKLNIDVRDVQQKLKKIFLFVWVVLKFIMIKNSN